MLYHGAASTCHGNFFAPFRACLGISFSQTRASHNKRDGFGWERATFRDKTISVASYYFLNFFECQHRTAAVLCSILEFFGVRLDILHINWVFQAFYAHNSNLNYMHILKCI